MEFLGRIIFMLVLFGVFIGLAVIPICTWFYGWMSGSNMWETIGIWAFVVVCLIIGGIWSAR